MARITVTQLHDAVTKGKAPLIVDVRSKTSRRLDGRILPGARLADLACIDRALHDVPFDQEMVIDCNCPNEATSATAAKALIAKGYRAVRPLHRGLDAWGAAGYPVQRLPSTLAVLPGNAARMKV